MHQPGHPIHIVGIGGFGMSAIARILLQRGYPVSGSDLRANELTQALAAEGATIYQGHAAAHIRGAAQVITSSAVPDDNPEVAAARAAGIPVLRRRDLLGELMAGQIGIAVAGTHGKTTTTALLAHTLIEAGQDPTYIVGGVMRNTGTNAGVGRGPHFVIEADEYDRMFLGLRPRVAVVTTIEHDHPDCFPAEADVIEAFEQFADRLPEDGPLVVCADDRLARALGERRRAAGKPVITYGLRADRAPDWFAADLAPVAAGGMQFTVRHGERSLGRTTVALAGAHNVQNALAVLAVTDHLGVPFARAVPALETFRGAGRRGEMMGLAGGVTVISDYAHHPTAIALTLEAFRGQPGVRDLWAVWQPHTYGRLRALADDFAGAFGAADHVLITDVYSVRETVSPGLDAPAMAGRLRAAGHPDARYTGGLEATAAVLVEDVRPGDCVLLLSAGDAPQIGVRVLDALRARDQEDTP